MSLFDVYHERPPRCRAVLVDFETLEKIAEHYAYLGTTLTRGPGLMKLEIKYDGTDPHQKHPPVDITIVLDHNDESDDSMLRNRVYLVDDRPPVLVPENEFNRKWWSADPENRKLPWQPW